MRGVMLIIAAVLALPVQVSAQQVVDLAQASDGLAAQGGAIATFITVLCFCIGVVMAFLGIAKLANSSGGPQGESKLTGFVFIALGALLVALPSTIGTGVVSMFGSGAQTLESTGAGGLLNYD